MEEQVNKGIKAITDKEEIIPSNGNIPNRDGKGKFLPGNKCAKGNKSVKIDKEIFIESMGIVEKAKNKCFWVRAFEMAWDTPAVMNKILDKFFADLSIAEIKGLGEPFNLFVTYFGGKMEEKEKELNEKPL